MDLIEDSWLSAAHKVLEQNGFKIVHENIDQVSEEEYIQIRMQGFGASDSSKLLNCNPFPNGTRMDLCKEKATGIYDESIGKKASVRMGKDIEHIILDKVWDIFLEKHGYCAVLKPPHMYGNEHHLNINYDGLLVHQDGGTTAVEAKAVTKYGRKYYDFSKAFLYQKDGKWHINENAPDKYSGVISSNIPEHCIEVAKHYGVPVYYYTQVEQQSLGTNTPFDYLAVMDVDNWDIYIFKIYKDEFTREQLNLQGDIGWSIVEIQKEKGEPK